MRALVAAAMLLALCGCMPPALDARHLGAQPGSPRQREAPDFCLEQMLASPEIQALKSKFPPLDPGSSPSQAQLADPTLATPQEAKLVLSFHQKYIVACRQEGLVRTSTIGPQPVAIAIEGFATADALILKLIEGKMTWGEYNSKIQVLRTDARAYLAAVAASQHNNPGLDDLAEGARQHQAAMVALDNWKRQQQALVRKQRQLNPGDPARLNDCTYLGATVTCTSL